MLFGLKPKSNQIEIMASEKRVKLRFVQFWKQNSSNFKVTGFWIIAILICMYSGTTVCKFHRFSITQTLCEINFEHSIEGQSRPF